MVNYLPLPDKKVPAELEEELEERLLEAMWLLGEDSSAPVELRLQWEEMVASKGWEGWEGQGKIQGEGQGQEQREGQGHRQGKGWERLQRARLAVASRWPGQPVLE